MVFEIKKIPKTEILKLLFTQRGQENKSVPIFAGKWVIISILFSLSFILFLFFGLRQSISGPTSTQQIEKNKISLNGFSSDNRLLSFDFCHNQECHPVLLDLHSGKISKILPPDPDEWWSSGRFSPNDKSLAFVVKRFSENSRLSQLGLYDISTQTLKIHTRSQSFKEFPSFSPDEKRLIFAQSNRERASGKTRFSDWDIFELDIETGQERQLTNYQFFAVDRPYYLPDGKHFIFAGEGLKRFNGKTGADAYHAYLDQFKNNTIFIIGPYENSELCPALTYGPLTDGPKISKDGKRIAYHGRSEHLNREAGDFSLGGFTFDIFMMENGQHRRLTNLKHSLRDYTMSPDGNWIAYTSGPREGGELQLWLLDINQNERKQIEIAIDALIKNEVTILHAKKEE
jgi:Tol biopolymer transport system component